MTQTFRTPLKGIGVRFIVIWCQEKSFSFRESFFINRNSKCVIVELSKGDLV